MRTRLLLCGSLAALLATTPAAAFELRGLTDNAIVYDAGSREAKPQFILLRGTPVEVIVATDRWTKVREAGGGMGWVERNQLGERSQVIVTAASAEVRQGPDAASPVVFTAVKDVLLTIADKPANGWVRVRHRDGQTGFVSVRAVWGL